MIKAINTEYKGFLFRSRLEARYAIFLDYLGIEWQYEIEGFVLSNGVWYLPDFYCPTFNGGMWIEVKPACLNKEDEEKCKILCIDTKTNVWLANGTPDFRIYKVYYWDDKFGIMEGDGIPNADAAENKNRMFAMSAYGNVGELINLEYRFIMGDTLSLAVKKAKQARFEHKHKK